MATLFSWFSKSSSASTSSSSSSFTVSSPSSSLVPSSKQDNSSPSQLATSGSRLASQDDSSPSQLATSLVSQRHTDSLNYPQILDAPHQPRSFHFPRRSFGSKKVVKRGFSASWFDSHTWLHYDESKDLAFCYLCMKAVRKNTLNLSRCADKAFRPLQVIP